MGEFPERIRKLVREKAHFRCCRCQNVGVDVHHIIPQNDGGPDDFDNAAPLCQKCHADFGDNPAKRKEIREMRDWWYQKCEEMYKTVVLLTEKPEPRAIVTEFPVVFFYHKKQRDLHWFWPNRFLNYYHSAAFTVQEFKRMHQKRYQKIVSHHDFYTTFFIHLIERLIFTWLSSSYQFDWLLERRKWEFPWARVAYASRIDHPRIQSETVNYARIRGFKKNIFSGVSVDSGSFTVPESTRIRITRGGKAESLIVMKNDYYCLQFHTSFKEWFSQMGTPAWLSGLTEEQQNAFAIVRCHIRVQAEPNSRKLTEDRMSFYQKWAEDICHELQHQFDWLTTFSQIKNEQICP